jgi:hypothetical protein
MSSADQILSARISALCRRRCVRGKVDDLDAAVAELRELAGDRPDLLAAHVGVSLGIAEVGLDILAPQFRAEAELCIAAGADQAQIPAWTEVGRKRAAQARLTPYSGSSVPDLVAIVAGLVLIERSGDCQTYGLL